MRLVRKKVQSFLGIAAIGAAQLAIGTSCGDDDSSTNTNIDVPLFDADGSFPDTTPADTAIADTTADARDATDTREVDTAPPDLVPDLEPPTVVSTIPAAGAENVSLPLEITIVFSEPLFATTIAVQTIKLFDWNDVEIPGTPKLQADGKTVKWKPTTNNQQLASRYTIRVVGNVIADLAGNKLVNTEEFTFTTANYPDQDKYRELAATYAPNIYSTVDQNDDPQFQIPTKLDSDGDWDLSNNRNWIAAAATTVVPAVYYAVTETYTHYFIQYSYYFPYSNHPQTVSHATGNAMNGVTVVVEKARGDVAERPIAAYAYWKESVSEENYAFATNESGIVGSGSAGDWGLKATFPQETLFPAKRFESYITAKSHRSCNWNWSQSGFGALCEASAAVKSGDNLVFKYLGGSPTPVTKKDNAWPTDMSDVEGQPEAFGYALIPLWTSMWTRRADAGPNGLFEVTTFTFTPDAGRPGANTVLSTKFLQSLQSADASAFGKPPWSWGWSPSVSSGTELVDAIVRGQVALDPAYYLWERHHRSTKVNSLTDYDPTSGAGFALNYCFNGFLAIDARKTDAKCSL
jgi:hypothetical protein